MDNKTYEYASVFLLDNPYCIDCTYDYFIPLELRGEVYAGRFVTVPFGRGNRKQLAVVKELLHCPSYRDAKPIAEVCTDRPELSEEMLSLCEYMKEQWLCTFGEAARCVMPSSVLGKMTEFYYAVGTKGPDASSGFEPGDLFVYDYLCTAGGKSLDSLKAKFGAAVAESATKKLLSKGMVQRELVMGKAMSEVYDSYYSLATDVEECRRLLDGTKLRSEKQRAILEALAQASEPMSVEDITSGLGVTKAQLDALVKKGLISLERRRVWRRAYESQVEEKIEYKLNAEQTEAFKVIKSKLDENEARAVLLHGVTGSGKTSVIISAIDEALAQGKGVIMLLPEIALTPQTLKIFNSRYGDRIALVHSGLSAGERYDSFARIKDGKADLVIGTRSAIFSPVKNLGLVIIDEEHETTYKSDTSPKYHARDIARWRCAKNRAVLLLASATPSIESYTKAVNGQYTLVKLKERYGGAELPEVKIWDMRNEHRDGNQSPIGMLLKEELKNTAERDEQSVLFLNRRGYNTSVG